jgi:uncharacterized phage protein (TIGR02220 family)
VIFRFPWYKRFAVEHTLSALHLSQSEEGAFALLFDSYYSTGKPLPQDKRMLYAIGKARTADEQKALEAVVKEFFRVGPDGLLHNERADAEIAQRIRQTEVNRELGRRGGRPRKNQNKTEPVSEKKADLDLDKEQEQPVPPLAFKTSDTVWREPRERKTRQEARQIAHRVIEHLNAKANTHFQNSEVNLKFAIDRVLEGATESELCAVVNAKVEENKRGEFDRRYLRPETLWNKTKFSSYVGLLSNVRAGTAAPIRGMAYAVRDNGNEWTITEFDPKEPDPRSVARRIAMEYSVTLKKRETRDIELRFGNNRRRFALKELLEK